MDFWKDLPNVSGILLTLIGTAMIFMSETSKWLEERRRTRTAIAIIFVILGIAGIIAGRIDRKKSERQQILAEERQRQLFEEARTSNQQLSEQRQMLLASQLAQEHLKGQLEGIGLIAGKIGQGTDDHMKQLVGAINKIADTGSVHTLTNKQLCTRAMTWAKRVREFEAQIVASNSSTDMWEQELAEVRAAKTQEEKTALMNRRNQALFQKLQQHDLNFKNEFLGEAIYLRDEITKRLPEAPPKVTSMSSAMFSGDTSSFVIQEGANYLEQLARTLCSE